MTDHDFLERDRESLYQSDMKIDEFELDPDTQTCATDFIRKEYADVDHVKGQAEMDNEYTLPVIYYDNEDGFWDDYIE